MFTVSTIVDSYCTGISFAITDETALSKAIALILVQEFALARQMISGGSVATAAVISQSDIDDIILRRLHPTDAYHRDGFLFQLMMWVASHLDLLPGDLVSLPHAQGSAKGQDGIIVHRSDQSVVALTICEDKATENPRDTVRDDVWPEIKAYQSGGRRDELRSNIIATLGIGGICSDEATKLIRGISWDGKLRYRVRVTIEPTRRTPDLFKGFDSHVTGDVQMRRGETVTVAQMRSWMTAFSAKVEAELRQFAVLP